MIEDSFMGGVLKQEIEHFACDSDGERAFIFTFPWEDGVFYASFIYILAFFLFLGHFISFLRYFPTNIRNVSVFY